MSTKDSAQFLELVLNCIFSMKKPESVHGESGKVVKFLDYDEIDFFDPLFEESLYN